MAAFGSTSLPLVHGVNGFRLYETAVYFERHTQFGHIPWPRMRPAAVFLDPTQSMTHSIGMADEHFRGVTNRCVIVRPYSERFEQHLARSSSGRSPKPFSAFRSISP